MARQLFLVPSLLALIACGGGSSGTVDGGLVDAGAQDAEVLADAGPSCATLRCPNLFEHCVDGACVEYEPCIADSCATAGEVCVADVCVPGTADLDGDGSLAADDCDDTNNMIFPGAPELCNGVDDNCDEQLEQGDPSELCSAYPGGGLCVAGSCGCPIGMFDLDPSSPGCECAGEPAVDEGLMCPTAIDLGSLADTGQMMVVSGNAIRVGGEVWYRFLAIDTVDDSCDNFHVRVRLTDNPGDAFDLTVFLGGCSDVPSSATPDFILATDFPASLLPGGQCPCLGAGEAPTPGVGYCFDDGKEFFVRVRRAAFTTCSSFTLELSNGVYDTSPSP